jgi:hypothetical protein
LIAIVLAAVVGRAADAGPPVVAAVLVAVAPVVAVRAKVDVERNARKFLRARKL